MNGDTTNVPMALRGLKQADGSYLFDFSLDRYFNLLGQGRTVNDCRYDSRFLENAEEHTDTRYGLPVVTAQRQVVKDSDDLFVDMYNEDMFPFFNCVQIVIRVRGENLNPADFSMCVKKANMNQDKFNKISEIMDQIAGSICLKDAAPAPAARADKAKKVSNPNCIMRGTVLEKYIGTEPDVVLPEGITELEDSIFSDRTKLRSIVIPETVKTIGYRAFENCFSLEAVALPSGLESIDSYAFVDCHHLKHINLGHKIQTIGVSAFSECYEMQDVSVSDHVQEIEAFAFKNCQTIKQFIIPDGVETIGFSAFTNCQELEHLFIPASVGTIKENPINQFMFAGCDKLVIHTPAGSFAEEYAEEHDIPVVTEEKASFTVKGLSRADVLASIDSQRDAAGQVSTDVDQGEDEEYLSRKAEEWMEENGAYVEKDPTIIFDGKIFVFSGIAMHTAEREDPVVQAVINKGGQYRSKVSGLTDYLIVDPRYCGESKTKAALEQQKKGKPVKIILLDDLQAALERKTKAVQQSVSKPLSQKTKAVKQSASKPLSQKKKSAAPAISIPRKTLPADFPKGKRVYPGDDLVVSAGTVTNYNDEEKDIILPAGITEIGAVAFVFSSLRSIVIPEGVTKIGDSAFEGCEKLTHVALPDSLKKIGKNAFNGCSKLEHIDLPDGLSEIGDWAFYKSGIKEITIPESCTTIRGCTFQNCLELSRVILHDGVEEIESFAFSDCPKLRKVYVPLKAKFDDCAFDDDCKIRKIIHTDGNAMPATKDLPADFPKGKKIFAGDDLVIVDEVVTKYSGLEKDIILPAGIAEIGANAFEFSSLRSIVIPKSVTKIGNSAFSCCKELTHVALPDYLEEIEDFAFFGCSQLGHIALPDSLKKIGKNAFDGCSKLEHIDLPDGLSEIGFSAFEGCSKLEHVDLPDGLSRIDYWAFQGSGLKEVRIPKSCASLQKGTFNKCLELESVTLHDGVEKIDSFVFWDCPKLKEIYVPVKTDIGDWAFDKDCLIQPSRDKNFNTAEPSLFKIVDGVVTEYYDYQTEVVLPAGITAIGENVFQSTSLRSVVIPEGVTRMAKNAFLGCRQLTHVSLPNSLKEIGEWAFRGCSKLEHIDLPDGLSKIGESAFSNTGLTEIQIPSSCSAIGRWAFSDCPDISRVVFHNKIGKIGDYAFSDCPNLTEVYIPSYAVYDNWPFIETAIVKMWNDDEQITKAECSEADSDKKHTEENPFPNAILVPESEMEKKDTELKKYLGSAQDIILPDGLTDIGRSCFYKNKTLRSVVIPFGVKHIGRDAFNQCKKLEYVSLPSTVETIGEDAFSACSSLKSIDIPQGIKRIKGSTFEECTGLTAVVIPEGVESIGKWAFKNAWNLMDVFLPSTIKTIEQDAFCTYNDDMRFHVNKGSNATRFWLSTGGSRPLFVHESIEDYRPRSPRPITAVSEEKDFIVEDKELKRYVGRAETVVVPKSVERIGNAAFCGNQAIKTVIFHDGVTSMATHSLFGCDHIETLILPDAIEELPSLSSLVSLKNLCVPYAFNEITKELSFYSLKKLRHIYLPPTITFIHDNEYMFYGQGKNVTVHAIKESFAEKYAVEHGLKVDNNIGDCWKIPLAKAAEEARRKEEEKRNDQAYNRLLGEMDTAKTHEEWSVIADGFTQLGNYKDAPEQADLCNKKASEIQRRIEESERIERERAAHRQALLDEKAQQEQILEQNKGLRALFGEKAKKRKAALARLKEIEDELINSISGS